MAEKKDILKALVETNDERIREEMVRPRVETFVDDWGAWVAYHRARESGEEFTPHLGLGYH